MTYSKLWNSIIELKSNKHFRLGLPMFVLIGGCWFYLIHSQSVRYEFKPQVTVDKKDLEAFGFKFLEKSEKKTLEEIYEEIKDKDLSQWENKRIPRPWEE